MFTCQHVHWSFQVRQYLCCRCVTASASQVTSLVLLSVPEAVRVAAPVFRRPESATALRLVLSQTRSHQPSAFLPAPTHILSASNLCVPPMLEPASHPAHASMSCFSAARPCAHLPASLRPPLLALTSLVSCLRPVHVRAHTSSYVRSPHSPTRARPAHILRPPCDILHPPCATFPRPRARSRS